MKGVLINEKKNQIEKGRQDARRFLGRMIYIHGKTSSDISKCIDIGVLCKLLYEKLFPFDRCLASLSVVEERHPAKRAV